MSAHEPKKVYIPHMCDHALILGATLRALGTPAEVLPPPDMETLILGRARSLGRECLPMFLTIGDILRRAQAADFVPAQSVYFMPTTSGPCRFGQYRTMIRLHLDAVGLHQVEIISPNAENGYQGTGDDPLRFRLLAWQGIVAVDLLTRLAYQYRPDEAQPGTVDALYHTALERLVGAVEAGGGRRIVAVMHWLADEFALLPLRRQPHPWIGIVGEIYLRANSFANQNIVRQVEALGGRVWVAPMMEWFYFTIWGTAQRARARRQWGAWLKARLIEWGQHMIEAAILRPVAPLLAFPHEPTMSRLMRQIEPYYDPPLGTEAALSVGKSLDFARRGVCGVLNLLPFACMPGTVVTGLAPAICADHDHLPWLDIIYDAQGETNIQTRLEAFMYQAWRYLERMPKRNETENFAGRRRFNVARHADL